MFRKKAINDIQVLILVRLIDASKKFLVFLALLGQLASIVPQRIIQAQSIDSELQENIIEYDTTDFNFDEYADVKKSDIPADFEIESMRSLNEKVFRKMDGSYEVSIYPDVVHYVDNGKYLDIDNTLEESTNSLKNKSNRFNIEFPKLFSANEKIKLSQDGYKINWRLLNSQISVFKTTNNKHDKTDKTELIQTTSSIIYENVLTNTDIEYILTGSRIKENIHIKSYSENLVFVFEYDVKNLKLIQSEEGIVFKNHQGDVVFSFSGLFMIDSENNISEDVKILSKQISEDIYEVTVSPSDEWLKTAVYPVIIDPTIVNPTINMSLVDTYVSQSSPTTNYHASTIMRIGGASGCETQGLVKFDLPELVMNQVITYAHLEFIRPSISVNSFQVNIYKNTSDFDISTVTWVRDKPSFDTNEVIDYYNYNAGITQVIFDVTQTIKEWQETPSSNFGFTLAADDLTGEFKDFYQYDSISSNRPIIRIGYENPSGLKDYWTYTSQDIDQVGTGYISDYTGNLTFVRNEYQVNNEYLPLSLTFYFNNATRTQNIGYGNGWKTNFNMKIEYDEDIYRYFMSKPDGSRMYFSETDSVYDDGYDYINYIAEDGSGMKLEMVYYNWELTSTTLKTTDLMTYIFDSQGRLTQITNDRNYHKLFVYYIGITDRLNYVSDMVGNRIDFTYTLYDTNYIMTKTELKLKQPGTATFNIVQDKTYSYYTASTNPRLYKIIQRFNKSGSSTPLFSTGDTLRYYFNSITSSLSYAYNDTSKHKVSYVYDSNSRVSTVNITDTTNGTANLGSINIIYGNEKTRYVNHKSEWIEYIFDTYGHTINAYDSFGNATYWKYAGLFTYNLDPSNYLNDAQIISYDPNYYIVHALLESSETMKQQPNYINNPGFEDLGSNLKWIKTGNGYIQKDIETSAFGDASLRIYNDGTTYAYQDVFLKAGVYTLQGIVKNTNDLVAGSAILNVETASNTFYDSTSVIGEWKHLNVQFEITSDQTVRIKLINARYNTNSYFDNISLTEGFMDARYNNVINPSFEEGTVNWILNGADWVSDNFYTDANQDLLGEKSLKIDGDGGSSKYFYQDISSFINNGVSYFIGGWGKANAVPHKGYLNTNNNQVSDGRFFGLYIEYIYYNSAPPYTQPPEIDYIFLPFNTSTDDWQYQMRTFEIDVYQLLSVRIYGEYQGEGTAFFDNIQIYRDKLNTEYDYDITNGYLDQIIESNGVTTSFEYDSNGNIIVIHEGGKTIEIDYFQNRLTEIEANNVKTAFTYDSISKQIKETLIGDTDSVGEWFKSSTTYTSDNQYIASQTNEFGHTTTLETDHLNGLIETITNANNHLKSYDYNNYGALTQEVETDISNQYTIVKDFTYDSNRRLSGISIDGISYSFHYDDLDRIIEVKIAGINYVTLNYVNEEHDSITYATGKTGNQTYGTGDTYTFIYTDEDQIKLIKFNDVDRYAYVYDQSGRLAIYKELQNNNIFFYSYDLTGRIKQITDKNGNKINYYYDEDGHINQYTYEVDQYNRDVYYYYDETTGEYLYTLYETGNETVSKINHIDTTDSLRRLEYIELLIETLSFTEHFTYKTPVFGRGNASVVVASISYKKDGNVQYTHHFTYDALGNIIEISVENENS
ncbi:MAG: DNRLRE domain-containing protein, partial [Acholeplasmataceae bacterium]|nr:DNRLRE domain-containing protein [Acholeplasmataceae bacterium]